MGKKKTHLKKHLITEGSVLVETRTNCALLGAPTEILKQILIQKLPMPNTVVLPTVLHKGQCSQAAIEFLFFYYLFLYKGLQKHGRFRIFATKTQCEQLKEAMRIVVIGPTEKEMLAQGMSQPMAQQLRQEMDYMAPHNPETGKAYRLDEMMAWHVLEIGQTIPLFDSPESSSEILIHREGKTAYQISHQQETLAVQIAFKKKQRPPYAIKHKPHIITSHQLSMTILGASDGLDPYAPANGYLLDFNGRLGIWDCPGFLHQHLQKLNIDFAQIEAVILSHVHEDHIDVVESIRQNNPLDFYCTPEVYYSFLLKMVAVMDCSLEEAKAFHRWHPIGVDQPYSILGADFEFFYSVHAIPSIGCRIAVKAANETKSILISGDHAPFELMENMQKEGVLPKDRFQESTHLVKGHEDLILIDVGGGTIHGDYKDYMDLDVKIHFMHTGHLPPLTSSKYLVKHADILDLTDAS